MQSLIIGALILCSAVLGAALVAANNTSFSTSERQQNTQSGTDTHESIVTPSAAVLESTPTQISDKLLYLIEEEKLAHDVYQTLYDIYGARTFSNIQNSETRHQDSVLTLLRSRNIADPRSSEVGVFHNTDLQALYDTLIARGRTSLGEAYAVSVLIEETDIADIDKTLDGLDPAQTDIKTVLDSLRRGSENHLRAFSSKV
jgi:hypothetical protein